MAASPPESIPQILKWLGDNWGNLVSLAGLVFSILAARAATKAETAAELAKQEMERHRTIADFATILAMMEEIKPLHRHGAWEVVMYRYSLLRNKLQDIQNTYKAREQADRESEEYKYAVAQLDKIIEDLIDLEALVEATPTTGRANLDCAKFNTDFSRYTRTIQRIKGMTR